MAFGEAARRNHPHLGVIHLGRFADALLVIGMHRICALECKLVGCCGVLGRKPSRRNVLREPQIAVLARSS
jgi:hypothetical protein